MHAIRPDLLREHVLVHSGKAQVVEELLLIGQGKVEVGVIAFLGGLAPVVGGPVFAMLIGMALALLVKDGGFRSKLDPGVKYTSKKMIASYLDVSPEYLNRIESDL